MLIQKSLRLQRGDICRFQFILEGYEGLVSVTTEDPLEARLRLSIAPDFREDVDAILLDLLKIFDFQETI